VFPTAAACSLPKAAQANTSTMTHGGEDGLLLLTQAMRVGAIEPNVGQPALVALAATMALGPMLIQPSARLAELVSGASHRTRADSEEAAIREESQNLRDHVILCGCGRVGRPVSLVLEATKVPYIAIEFDLIRFRRAKKAGHKVVFGDAGRKRVLEAAGVARARLVVVTFDQRHTVERILHYARGQNPAVSSIVSVSDDKELLPLARAGASIVFPENVAAGLTLADQVLLVCGFSQDNASNSSLRFAPNSSRYCAGAGTLSWYPVPVFAHRQGRDRLETIARRVLIVSSH
jgi:CPA2 family monovalent cation:H+ antiporter-2